jgi:hypothetical protein
MTILTIGIYFVSWGGVGIAMNWCNVNLAILFPLIIPLAWSIYLLCSYRTTSGKVGSWISFFGGCFYLWVGCAMFDFSLF